MHWREIIRRPVITEKSNYMASELNQYTFVVHTQANKMQIKEAVELAWPNVEVEKVRVSNMPAKRARRWRQTIYDSFPIEQIEVLQNIEIVLHS